MRCLLGKSDVDYTPHKWNPVSGCLHGCPWCYARSMVRRFTREGYVAQPGAVHVLDEPVRDEDGKVNPWPFGFEPTFHRYRLTEPLTREEPTRIFVVNMGDLFGAWVPADWITEVLSVIRACPQHSFLLLTKNPRGYWEPEFPDNAWLGTTVTGVEENMDAERFFPLLTARAKRRWVSYEPMLGPYPRAWVGGMVDWLVLGAQTGPGAKPPERSWVADVAKEARSCAVPLFIKSNLAPYCREWGIPVVQEYPAGMVGAR